MGQNDMYGILETHVGPFLEIEEFNNVLMTNKDIYTNQGSWNYYFCEQLQKPVCFTVSGKNVKEWKFKNIYDKKDKLCLSRRKLKMYHKIKKTPVLPFFDILFPKYDFQKSEEKQIFVDRHSRMKQWNGYYFEIYFPIMIHQESIQIGFCQQEKCHDKLKLIGWNRNSIGFHIDDSHMYYRSDKLCMRKIEKWDKETFFLGAGFDFEIDTFFFTVNGKKICSIKNPFEKIENWQPLFLFDREHLQFIFNDGKTPFHFDLKN